MYVPKPNRPTRALLVTRLSRVTEATTSPERQMELCESLCDQRGWKVVDRAMDLNVSAGDKSPWERPQLAPWLKERHPEFDVIVVWMSDRISRSVIDSSKLLEWAAEHGKSIITQFDGLDITDPNTKSRTYFDAMSGEDELRRIRIRNTNAAQYNIRRGKYRGSVAPCGYRAEKNEGKGWRLIPDEPRSADDAHAMAPIIREIVYRVLNKERVSHIVWDLNQRGVLTQRDRQAELKGRDVPKRREWSISNLRRILASPTLIGQTVVRDSTVDGRGRKVYLEERILIGDDGSPLVKADPLISVSEYKTLQALLVERETTQKGVRRSQRTTLLLQVLFCGECNKPMYKVIGSKGRKPRYRCSSTQTGKYCGSGSVMMSTVDDAIERFLLALIGDLPWVERKYSPGVDHAETIAEIDAELESLAEAVTRFRVGSAGFIALLAKVDLLQARRDELAVVPYQPAGYRYFPTEETFRAHWNGMGMAERNDYLRENSIRATYRKGASPPVHVTIPDLTEMYEGLSANGEEKFAELAARASEDTTGLVRVVLADDESRAVESA